MTRGADRPAALKGTRRIDSNRVVSRTAEAAANVVSPNTYLAEVDWGALDRSEVPVWIEQLRDAERDLRQLRRRLESLDAGDRRCPGCGQAVAGRADRVYCGATCRQRARRASHLQP